jgi:hypothetical protein
MPFQNRMMTLVAFLQAQNCGPTLRDNLGLAIPRAAEWHAALK